MIVGQFLQFVIAAVLYWMGNKHKRRVGAERFGPGGRTFDELRRCHTHSRNSAFLEVCHVMRTARNAGASIGQSFDDEVDFGGDLLPQWQRRYPGIGRLGVMLDGNAALADTLTQAAQEHIATRFGDVENAYRQPVQPFGPRQTRPGCRTSFRSRVEKYGHINLF